MSLPAITNCPATLAKGFDAYSPTALKRVFGGKKVSHILPYDWPGSLESTDDLFDNSRVQMSVSGVQEKFSLVLVQNRLRLAQEGEQGQYILKPFPRAGKNPDQMPANEHVSMQIARQVFGIETAENALIFFENGATGYLTKRFDVKADGSKNAQEDFASLAGITPQTHGANYKYQGSYLDLFTLMQKYVPAYRVEAPRLFKIILFNYLICNGDAHYKNFSLVETTMGDFRLSPAYDLLNSRMHISDNDFALDEGLLPKKYGQGNISQQFYRLGEMAGIPATQIHKIFDLLTSKSEKVLELIDDSYLSTRMKRSYQQAYLGRLKKFGRSLG